jgi:hypothetical protein
MPTSQPFTKSGGQEFEFQEVEFQEIEFQEIEFEEIEFQEIEFEEVEIIIPLYMLSVESNSSEQQQYSQKRFRIYFDTQIF